MVWTRARNTPSNSARRSSLWLPEPARNRSVIRVRASSRREGVPESRLAWLEPVPEHHVLTKSFYLLKSFPGRYDTSPLWVESDPEGDEDAGQGRRIDGVSSILITSNDFAGAWAIDENGSPLYAVVPGGEEQREFAYRVGVNIVMYALTGNYKADQVHVPALLERLGQ